MVCLDVGLLVSGAPLRPLVGPDVSGLVFGALMGLLVGLGVGLLVLGAPVWALLGLDVDTFALAVGEDVGVLKLGELLGPLLD